MGFKFAHMSDLHLGAQGLPVLQEIELASFEKAIKICLEEKVQFILLSGDIFDSNLPNLDVVNKAAKLFREVKDQDIPLYYISGSHDVTVGQTSIINIFDSAGLFTKVAQGDMTKDNKVRLKFFTDPKTGAKITGIPGRINSTDKLYYNDLDLSFIEAEKGFKIFMFHIGIDEVKPISLARMDSIPLSLFPRHFDYYAGGHFHKKIQTQFDDYGNIAFPGPIFAGRSKDFEDSAKGEKRGFFIVDVEETIKKIDFKEIELYPYHFEEVNANQKASFDVFEELKRLSNSLDIDGKIVILRIHGELSVGKTADINFSEITKRILERHAKFVSINRFSLKAKEVKIISDAVGKPEEIEQNVFLENVDSIKVNEKSLKGKAGATLAMDLLKVLRQPKNLEEKTYEDRIDGEAKDCLKLKEVLP